MKFNNWKLTDSTIEWAGGKPSAFSIPTAQLLDTEKVADNDGPLYKWILLATAEDWLDDDELYDLNFAFVYAAGAAGLKIDYQVFDATLDYQFEILDDGEDEDDDDDDI
ncbi:MAG: hypothetical protein JWQ27_3127 [Ferruginibacter sp.]|nr:hypothetical protein [Ferruginibacter sp.]